MLLEYYDVLSYNNRNITGCDSIKIKRIVVAGCRNFNDYELAKEYIDFCISEIKKTYELIFISGGCRGADALGERYALENGFEIERCLADWGKFGKSAGPIRNEIMAEKCDYIICFWDGKSRGTKSMINLGIKKGKPVRIKRI